MAALQTPQAERGMRAPDFKLKGTDGKWYTLADVKGEKGTVVMFICNHCPYVQAVIDRIVTDMKTLQQRGIGVAAIMSNDTVDYPEDSYDNMVTFARRHGFTFPYLIDETQSVAQGYGAVCTPDFFGYDAKGTLQYRGRLDASRKDAVPNAKRDLLEAMTQLAESGAAPAEQFSSMGCSIKWRNKAA